MDKHPVSVVRYEAPGVSVRRAIELIGGLEGLKPTDKVYIKPNVVYWNRFVNWPKWGVLTTSRVVEDVVTLLAELGVRDITIGEGIVTETPKDKQTPAHAFEHLGYNKLKQRYGVRVLNIFEEPFVKVDVGQGIELEYNQQAMESDFLINLPVLKTHSQTIVSLGTKNLKGLISANSRKLCHNESLVRDLDFHVARLADKVPPGLTLIDGLYTLERGPSFSGKPHRSNILVGSNDTLSADLAGAALLGYDPAQVPHLAVSAREKGRAPSLETIEVRGEAIESLAKPHGWEFSYNEEGTLPLPYAQKGMTGINYYKFDHTMCTYCSGINGAILAAIGMAWKGQPFDDVEVLTGKIMQPRPGMKKTILLGKCMYLAQKDNPNIQEMIPIKGCPPQPKSVHKALEQAGIHVDPAFFENLHLGPGFMMKKFEGRPEFEEAFYTVD